MFITSWKDSNTLQVVINTIIKGIDQVTRSNFMYPITVILTKYIITYQKHMGRIDCGD